LRSHPANRFGEIPGLGNVDSVKRDLSWLRNSSLPATSPWFRKGRVLMRVPALSVSQGYQSSRSIGMPHALSNPLSSKFPQIRQKRFLFGEILVIVIDCGQSVTDGWTPPRPVRHDDLPNPTGFFHLGCWRQHPCLKVVKTPRDRFPMQAADPKTRWGGCSSTARPSRYPLPDGSSIPNCGPRAGPPTWSRSP
jgi:hypothetical protein